MLKATLRSLLARKSRLLLSALSIVLGVAFVAGSLMFTNLLSRSFDAIVSSTVGDVNVVTADSGFADFTTAVPEVESLLTPDDVARIAAVEGVERSQPLVSSAQMYLVDADGQLVAISGAPGIGSNWHDTPAAGGLEGPRIVEGRAPDGTGEVVVDPSTVERAGYAIGDEVDVATPLAGVEPMTLVGTATYGSGSTAGASYLFFTLEDAQRLMLGGADRYQGVWIQTAPEADVDVVAADIDALLPDGFQATTGEEMAAEFEELLDVGLGFVNNFLLIFAAIALLIATLLILNTFSILVAQRAREMALMRAIGATRRQVRHSVLLEAAIVGIIGSTLGILLGYALVWGLLALMSGLGLSLGEAVPQLTMPAVVASYAVGIVVTVIAALVPAVRASRTRPVEALAEAAAPKNDGGGGVMTISGVVLMEIAVALIVCGVWLDVPSPIAWVGIGAALALVGMVLAAPLVGAPIIHGLGWVVRRLFGEIGRIAVLNSQRQPRRTAATAATLMIGLALVTTVAVLAASVTTSLREQLSADQRGDFVLAPVNFQPFDARVAEEAAQVEGVDWVASFASGAASLEEGAEASVLLTGTTTRGLLEGSSTDIVAGTMTDEPDSAVITSEFAADEGLSMGMLFDLHGPLGSARVLVTGIADDAGPTGDVVLQRETFATIASDALVTNAVVFLADGADAEQVRAGLRDATSDHPTVVVSDVQEYIDQAVGQFEAVVAVLYALLGLALVISVLGIVNTLSLSVIERTREIGLLRAVGITRGQVRRMVSLESVLITVMGSLLGVLLGVVFGSVLMVVNQDSGISVLEIPWGQVALFVVLAALFGWLAAIGPARRAAKLPVLDSIATE
ncbi:MAG: FtsX-like permease family protein [Propionibacterium sp.]|nr:FtsX-like permease family protein [Propionibacterium sp.]